MQYRVFSAFLIFIGSYLPLAIILAIQDIPPEWWARSICSIQLLSAQQCSFVPFGNPLLALVFLFVTLASVILANITFKKIPYPYEIEVLTSKPTPNDIINYVFPYVVSFMGISYSDPEKLLGFGVFLIWMFAITYKSGQIIMNPLLLMFDWHLYEASIQINGVHREVRVLKKGDLDTEKYMSQTIQDFYVIKD
mgnify:CR=1 FL=1